MQRPSFRKIRRIATIVLVVAIGIPLLAGGLFLLRPVREAVLDLVVDRVASGLPGETLVADAAWPSAGTVDLRGVTWTLDGDTLFAGDRILADVSLASLVKRDLAVRRLLLDGRSLDLPRVRAALTPAVAAKGESKSSSSSFLRPGELPPLPSVSVESVQASLLRLRLDESRTLADLAVGGDCEFRRDHPSGLHLQVAVRDLDGRWRLEDGALDWTDELGMPSGGGVLWRASADPLQLRIASVDRERFELALGLVTDGILRTEPGLVIDGKVVRGDLESATIEIDGRFLTPDLPARADDAPRLEGLAGRVFGDVAWDRDGPRAAVTIAAEPNAWCDGVDLHLNHDRGTTTLDTLRFRAEGLDLSGGMRVADGSLDGRIDVEVRGAGWLGLLQPDASPPEHLIADMNVVMSGAAASPAVNASLSASLGMAALQLDDVRMSVEVDEGWATARAGWSATGHDLIASATMDLVRRDREFVIGTSPVTVALRGREPETEAVDPTRQGRIRIDGAQASAEFEHVRLAGAFGELRVGGRWEQTGSEFRAEARWPTPPRALDLFLPDTTLAALADGWRDGAVWAVDLQGRLDGELLDLAADLRLPGPRHVTPLFESPTDLRDLGALAGTVRLRGSAKAMTVDADLSATDWIETASLAAHGLGDSLVVDALRLRVLNVDVAAAGAVVGDRLSAAATIGSEDASQLLRDVAGIENVRADAVVDATLAGRIDAPDLRCRLRGSYADTSLSVAEFEGLLTMDDRTLQATLRAPSGMSAGGRRFDEVVATYAGARPGEGEGRVSLLVQGPDLSARSSALVSLGEAMALRADTLDLAAAGRRLGLEHPFDVRAAPGESLVEITGFALAGDLGRLRLDARYADGVPSGHLDLDLDLPAAVYPAEWSTELRPTRIAATADVSDGHGEARVDVGGFALGRRADLDLVLAVEDGPDAIESMLTIADGPDTLAVAVSTMTRGDITSILERRDSPLRARLRLNGLPLPSPADGSWEDGDVVMDGEALIGGTSAKPEGSLRISFTPQGWRELTGMRLDLRAELAGADAAEPGLSAEMELLREARRLIRGTASYPGAASFSPPGFLAAPDAEARVSCTVDSLMLGEFTPLLPETMGVQGQVDGNLEARGSMGNSAVSGKATLRAGRFVLPDGSWVEANGDTRLSGSLAKPALDGSLVIVSGALRLPDPPQNLHPVHATPVLWAAADSLPKAAGEPRADASPATAPLAPERLLIEPTAAFGVSIPSGVWLRGQGLEIELRGDLALEADAAKQDVGGELTAVRGSYRFLGRYFEFERGVVSFDEGESLDPALDISLTTFVDGDLYRVSFGGTLLQPTLQLGSEPDLPEGDIMAILLFGRPLEELSSDQEGLVKQRATDLVAAYGTAQLEARLSQQLNVDMVNLRRGGAEGEDDALVIGKRLNQNVLVIYEQVLDEWSAFFVNLEYQVTKRLKLETMISRHGRSAASINWTVDY